MSIASNQTVIDTALYQRALQSIAHGALTNSKRPESFVKGVYPTHLKKGLGCYVWDTNGKKYIDFIAGLGSSLLGYNQEEVTQAIIRQAREGATLSLGTRLEVEVAEKIKEIFPFVEKLRFLKTGSEACSAALRIARTYKQQDTRMDSLESSCLYTGSQNYHGWHDDFVSLTPPSKGVPSRSWMKGTTDVNPEWAAVIIEPVNLEDSPKRRAELMGLKKTCQENGTALIFDEIITGLRFPGYSVSQCYDVTPDLICLGKALANGMPLTVVGGRSELMDSDYFVSSTFSGETLSLAAAKKTIELLQTKFSVETLWEKGQQFMTWFNQIWREEIWLEGYATRSAFRGDALTRALFMQECCKAGILIGPSFFFTFPHMEVMEEVISTMSDILKRIRLGDVKREGDLPLQPYAAKVRNT